MEKVKLIVKKRTVFGRKVKQLRKAGLLVGNVFGNDFKSKAIELDLKDFKTAYDKAGETGVLELDVDGEKEKLPVLIHSVQFHPVTDEPLHVDFLKVDLTKKVIANVPLEITGEAPVVKQNLGTLVQYVDEVEVEALPGDLPENILVDITKLTEVDQAILISDLSYDKEKVEIKSDLSEIVAKIEVQKEEAPEEVATVSEVAEEEEGKKEEVKEESSEETPAEKKEEDK